MLNQILREKEVELTFLMNCDRLFCFKFHLLTFLPVVFLTNFVPRMMKCAPYAYFTQSEGLQHRLSHARLSSWHLQLILVQVSWLPQSLSLWQVRGGVCTRTDSQTSTVTRACSCCGQQSWALPVCLAFDSKAVLAAPTGWVTEWAGRALEVSASGKKLRFGCQNQPTETSCLAAFGAQRVNVHGISLLVFDLGLYSLFFARIGKCVEILCLEQC